MLGGGEGLDLLNVEGKMELIIWQCSSNITV